MGDLKKAEHEWDGIDWCLPKQEMNGEGVDTADEKLWETFGENHLW